MKQLKLNLIVAVCENKGIGFKGDLPWRLQKELRYFSQMTKKVADPAKKNVVIMGRKTYFGVPESKRPLRDRLNIILTRNPTSEIYPDSVVVCQSMAEALKKVSALSDEIENVWIVGGSSVYEEAMKSDNCHRIYLTEVMSTFECDTFFPEISKDFKIVPNDPDVSSEVQEENGIKYCYRIYEKMREI